jgi:replicative DNA helicase
VADVPEPPGFYYEKLVDRHIRMTLTQSVRDVNENLMDDPRAALERFRGAIFDLSRQTSLTEILDFREAADVIIPAYLAKGQGASGYNIKLGWSSLDKMTGGLGGGDLVSFVGRPQQGKTQLLLWAALNVWREQRKPAMFVSMEMKPELIMERAAGIHTSTPLSEIRHQRGRRMVPADWMRFKKKLYLLKEDDVPLWIVDGKLTSTVEDIFLLAAQMKPAALFVDGAYLLQHSNDRLARHERIAKNCDLLKGMVATDLNIPVTCTWQFNREGAKSKAKRGERGGGMENIAGSDTIATHSSLICSLLEEDGDPSTLVRRVVHIEKGRQGEAGKFEILWNWEAMDFSEYVEPEVDAYYGVAQESPD